MTDTFDNISVTLIDENTVRSAQTSSVLKITPGILLTGVFGSWIDFFGWGNQQTSHVILWYVNDKEDLCGFSSIRRKNPQSQVVVISDVVGEKGIFEAFWAGAVGYLNSNVSPVKLIEFIYEANRGGAPLSPDVARIVVSSFRKNSKSPLSKRETEVLELATRGKTYSSIAEELFVDKETIKSHLKSIYSKLYVHSRADAIEKAMKCKYI